MANLNRIILVGRLTADPENRTTADGLPVGKFCLAVGRPFGEGENAVDFIDVVAWQKLAAVCGEHLKKGSLVLVEGRIQNRSFDDQTGQRRWVTEVVARNMTPLGEGAAVSRQPSVVSQEPGDDEQVDDSDLASDLPF